jgi:hypothetical protein
MKLWNPSWILTILVIISCGTAKNQTQMPNAKRNISIESELREQGLTIHTIENVEQPFFKIPGKAIVVNNDQMIQVFEFINSKEAGNVRSTISPDGMTIATSKPFWAEPPHFFHRERVILLYVGQDKKILTALKAVFGPQFAGK